MIPALFTSSSALEASQIMLSVVGNNLANSNTNGYKSQTLLFSNQFSQVLDGASEASATSGGRNPVQIGMGVQVAATDTNLTQGTFQSTGNALDMAAQGNGYFVLHNADQTVFTRVGSFAVDSNGNLVDPATGAKVQRVGNVGLGTPTTPAFQDKNSTDIKIPKGLAIPGVATQNVTFKGNLNASATGPMSEVLTAGQALTSGGTAATLSTSLDSLDQTTLGGAATGYQAGDSILITGTRVDGTPVNVVYSPTGTSTSDTVGSLLDVINEAFLSGTATTGATATLDTSGRIVLTSNKPGPSQATLQLSTNVGNASGTTTQFPTFTQTVAGKAGDSASSVIQVYDTQGTAHDVTFTFEKMANNTWNVTASLPSTEGTITGFGLDNTVSGLTFNADGSIANIAGTGTAAQMVTQNPMTVGGMAATLTTPLQSLDQHTPAATPYGATDMINITGTDYNGNSIAPVSVPAFDPITGNPSTVGDLITAINSAYKGGVATLDASGNIDFIASQIGATSLSIKIADDPANTGGSTTSFANFNETVAGTNGDPNITFQINSLNGIGTPQTIKLGFGTPGSFNGVTQNGGATSVTAANQDGYAQGTLQSTSVDSSGIISGQFSNGQTAAIAQVALATFSNPGGLQNVGNNYFNYTGASGMPNISAPGTGGAGTIQSGGLEGSNVDIGTEFTQLISAQRGYQVNAKAFSVANQMMQDAVDLLR